MKANRLSVFMGVFMLLVTCLWRVDQGWAQAQQDPGKVKPPKNELKEVMNAAAKQRKVEGLGKTTTTDDRKAAAKRNADRKAQHQKNLQAKGGATQ